MAEIQYASIKVWPGKLRDPQDRVNDPFKATPSKTLSLLSYELDWVAAEAPVLQLAIQQFTRDGRPALNARFAHPGVILTFVKPVAAPQLSRVPLRFAADRFNHWHANLRAIAMGLENLRRIDRYGISSGSEQYLGFKALPPPGPNHIAILTVEDAARFIESQNIGADKPTAAAIVNNPQTYRAAYRTVASKLHPDSSGKYPMELWEKLQAAQVLLNQHHERT